MSKGMCQVRFFGLALGTNLSKYLRRSIHRAAIFGYWVNTKKKIEINQVGEIDWEVTGREMKQCNVSRQYWISKFSSGWCGTGKMLNIRRERLTAACPICNYKTEDTTHISDFKSIWAKPVWDASVGN